MVRASPDGDVTPLPIDPAAFLRFDLSPDGRQLAAVVEGIEGHELRIYDLDTGQSHVWLVDGWVGQPLWSPDGERLIAEVGETRAVAEVFLGSPTSPAPPDMVARITNFWPGTYYADSLIVARGLDGMVTLDVRTSPATVDTIGGPSRQLAISPDGRWLAYWSLDILSFLLEPWPSRDRVYSVAGGGGELAWVSADEVVTMGSTSHTMSRNFFRTRIDPDADPPYHGPDLWMEDPLLAQTPGPSLTATPDGGVIYLQRLVPNVAHFVRVIPDWVEQMKQAVDEANR